MNKWTLLSSGVLLAMPGMAAARTDVAATPSVQGRVPAATGAEPVYLAQGLGTAPVGAPAIDQGIAPRDPGANATTTPQVPAGVSADGLADIVVTAQRRDQSLQDVPLSVQAFSAVQIQNKGATSLNDLPSLVPGVTVLMAGPSPRVFIRGVGNANDASSGGTVITMIDGVYQPFLTGIPQFVGINGIEVDKGPQGTLFGRNATGGAIQVSTRKPDSVPTFEAHAGYANYDTVSGDLYASTGVSDKVRANISGYFSQRRNGWGTNLFNGKDVYTDKQYGARSKWDIDVSDATTIEIIGDYLSSRFDVGAGMAPDVGYPFGYNVFTNARFTLSSPYDVNQNFGPKNTGKQGGVSAKVKSEITDGITLTSTSFWRKTSSSIVTDFDGTPGQFGDIEILNDRRALSQELQLASDKAERFHWVAGVFYYNEKADNSQEIGGILGNILGSPPGQSLFVLSREKTDSIAVYGQASYEFLPRTTLTVGGRYTEDKRVTGGDIRLGAQGAALDPTRSGEQDKTFKKATYRVAVDHKVDDDILVYASTSTGFNAGGFGLISPPGYGAAQNPLFEPEEITAYEVGIKSGFFDNRVRANIAAFWYDYTNLQQTVVSGPTIITINAGKARMKGVDFELSARPISNLTLSLNGEYLDAKYRSYPLAPGYEFGPQGQLNLYTLADRNGGVGAAGRRLIYAPKWSLNPDVTYVIPTEIGEFSTSANLQWRTKSYVDPDNKFFIRSLSLVNLSERWTSADEKTDVRLWVNNLTNKAYSQSIKFVTPLGAKGDVAPPRTYGVTIGRKF